MGKILYKELSYQLQGIFFDIRNNYGPGQKEIVYANLLAEQFKKADDTKRKSDLAQIQRALEAYYQDFGMYPDDNNATSTYKIVVGG